MCSEIDDEPELTELELEPDSDEMAQMTEIQIEVNDDIILKGD